MFGKNKSEALFEEMEQFPTLLVEPWRVQELVTQESTAQRYRLFRSITWVRFIMALIVLLFFIVMQFDGLSIFVLSCYSVLICALLISSTGHADKIHQYSFFMALLDVLILGYLSTVSTGKIELGFIFFSTLLSSLLLPLGYLLFVILLSSSVVLIGWGQINFKYLTDYISAYGRLPDEIFSNPIFFGAEKSDIQTLITLLLGLFVLGIITNRMANWSFTNEVKAQFRYRQLRQVLSFNRSVIEHLKSGVLVLTHSGKVISINQRAIELLNLQETDAVIELSDLSRELVERYRRWQSTEIENNFAYQHNAGAQEVFVSFSGFGYTEQKNITMMTLESINETLQQTQEAKLTALGRLTAGVAHEIRNPLSSINSAAQLLSEDSDNPSHQKLSTMILNNVKRTNQIINDILGLFKDSKAERELLFAGDVLKEFCNDFVVSNKDHVFKMRIVNEAKTPVYFMFDYGQLGQVLWNLCHNAIKYADAKELLITLKYSISTNRKNLYIDVIDNGLGIAEDKITHIFEPFYTGGESGSGLGLYLVRELCGANHASIQYIPSKDRNNVQGACFRLSTLVYFSDHIKPNI